MKPASLVLLFTALVGCVSDPGADPFEPDQVTTGIYQLAVTTLADTCDPPRFVGDAQVGLFEAPTEIKTFDIGAASSVQYSLPAADGYATQTPAAGKHIDPCSPSNNSFAFTYALTGASSDHVTVVAEETWALASACPATEAWMVDTSVVPKASCGATRELHYELISACAPPCTVLQTTSLTCSCS